MELIIAHDADWQTPAKTEQYAYEMLRNNTVPIKGAVYFAFPWASLIDGLERKTPLGSRLENKLKELLPRLKEHSNKRIVSVCQHIKFKRYYSYFQDAGITDLFASHKEVGQTNLGGINLYPLQLYPVQAADDVRESLGVDLGTIDFETRKHDFSFVGAFDSRYYLTNSRELIFKHLKDKSGLVTKRASWHYQARVYDEQVLGKELDLAYLTEEERNAREYIQILQNSKFSLCPSGTGPNSIRLWESIEMGVIPIILADTLDLPGDRKLWQEACVLLPETEQDIKTIPKLVSDIANSPTLVQRKLKALALLKEQLGLKGFTDHIFETISSLPDYSSNANSASLVVDCSNLTSADVVSWADFLEGILLTLELDFEVYLLNTTENVKVTHERIRQIKGDLSFDFTKDFVSIFDSRTLSFKLLSSFKKIYITPKAGPTCLHNSLYPIANELLEKETNEKWNPMCTLITSMFNGDEYKQAFLDNVSNFDQLNGIELLVFRPASRGHEHDDLMNFGQATPSLIYLWLANDPGLYDVWNLGTRLSSSAFCSNANIDDKRAPDHIVSLVKSLQGNLECSVASSALRVTDHKEETWESSSQDIVWYKPITSETYGVDKLARFDNAQQKLISHNIPHCMPVWRADLHRKYGFFAEKRFGPSSDWEFWLRAGICGEKFYLLNRDLGLYYRAPQSYWRRDPNAKNYDVAIVNEYFSEGSLREKRLSSDLKTFQFSELVSCFRNHDYYAGLSLLYSAAKDVHQFSATELKLIDLICHQYLNIDFNYLREATERLAPVDKVKDTFFDFIGFYLRGLISSKVSKSLKNRLLETADKIICTESELIGSIVKAKIFALIDKSNLEKRFLVNAYLLNNYGFWCNVNRVYGLQKPLSHFIEHLQEETDVPRISQFSWLKKGCKLFYLPDYSHGNPYQKLLYQNFEKSGVQAVGVSEADSIDLNLGNFTSGDVLHIHWINILFKNQTLTSIDSTLSGFLEKLSSLQSKGVKVVWTVHNRQNHETLEREIELEFRRKLSELCDAVLLHHPMIKDELRAWLSPKANLEIIEHGLYDNYYPNTLTKIEARDKLELENDRCVIATLGQIREYKDLPEKIEQFNQVSAEQTGKFNYLIAGKIACTKTNALLNEKPNENIRVVNRFISDDEVQIYLNAADIVLLSYRDILTSGSFFQAVTFNRIVFSPKLGSLQYYVVDGVNGFLYGRTHELSVMLADVDLKGAQVSVNTTYPCWPAPSLQV